jgi:hypothetical protein
MKLEDVEMLNKFNLDSAVMDAIESILIRHRAECVERCALIAWSVGQSSHKYDMHNPRHTSSIIAEEIRNKG